MLAIAAKLQHELESTLYSAHPARFAPKVQGERLPVPAGWRFGRGVLRSFGAMTWLG